MHCCRSRSRVVIITGYKKNCRKTLKKELPAVLFMKQDTGVEPAYYPQKTLKIKCLRGTKMKRYSKRYSKVLKQNTQERRILARVLLKINRPQIGLFFLRKIAVCYIITM